MSAGSLPSTRSDAPGSGDRARKFTVLKHAAEIRQLGIIATYVTLLACMEFVPACRNLPFLAAACWFSFLNAVVLHNSLHQGPFQATPLNMAWRMILSFGALYPASANIPSHNLVHHHFDDEGQPDWAAPEHVRFRWHLLNLVHFPNVAGPRTFAGVTRWATLHGKTAFRKQYLKEQVFAFGLTGVLLVHDFWTTLFFVVIPQLYGARCILRINLIQHDGCDTSSEWNHSRNFVGRGFNWIMCNNGLHTIHHNRAGLHWSDLRAWHDKEVVPRIDPSLNEPSMVLFLLRTYVFGMKRPAKKDVALAEANVASADLASRETRRQDVEAQGALT
ncbi:MAG: fatty acid desaturase [Polyangiaceae bacterium]